MRVAAFQRHPVFDNLGDVGERLAEDLRWADAQGVALAVFSECWLQGHAYIRETIERRAVTLDDPALQAVLGRVAGAKATAIVGAFERCEDGICNSALVVAEGRVVGRYAKLHPNEVGVTPGRDAPTFTCGQVRYGINICNDANYPEAAQRVADAGAKLICFPLSNLLKPEVAAAWRVRSLENLRARASQTGCWVVSADVVGRHGATMSYGCTAVVRPDGVVMDRVAEHAEGAIVFDLC